VFANLTSVVENRTYSVDREFKAVLSHSWRLLYQPCARKKTL